MQRSARLLITVILSSLVLTGCSSMLASAKQKMASNLSNSIINNDDLETVKTGAPAYLLLIDSFIEGNDSDDPALLEAAASLYSAYAGVFVEDNARARRLTQKALDYALRASCLRMKTSCGLKDTKFEQFSTIIQKFELDQAQTLYTLGSAWAGWIQSRSGDWNAAAEIARVSLIMQRVVALNEKIQSGQAHLYLGILETLLPPALGGKPEKGKVHFERAIELAEGKNLMAKVLYAKQYARLLFKQELHDRLLKEVLAAEPRIPGFTLMNMLAQKQARELLESGKEYF